MVLIQDSLCHSTIILPITKARGSITQVILLLLAEKLPLEDEALIHQAPVVGRKKMQHHRMQHHRSRLLQVKGGILTVREGPIHPQVMDNLPLELPMETSSRVPQVREELYQASVVDLLLNSSSSNNNNNNNTGSFLQG